MNNPALRDIKELLPHRDPFVFLDKVLSFDGEELVAQKTIKGDEEYLKGHFPDNPLLPGVLMIESMAQAAGICAAYAGGDPEERGVYFLSRVTDIKFKHPVLPGDNMEIKAKVSASFGSAVKVDVELSVGENVCAKGELVLAKPPKGD